MTPIRVAVTADGSPDPQWMIRDQESLFEALPLCSLPDLETPRLTLATLNCYPATVSLPAADTAVPIEVPDHTWHGWDWPSGDAMLLQVWPEAGLPGLSQLMEPDDSWCQVRIANRPMGVILIAPGDPRWAAPEYAAEVYGFIDNSSRLWAQVRSPTAAGRDTLLAAFATFRLNSAS